MDDMTLAEILDLSSHGADVMVGSGPTYPWGALYGGQIVAQALMAAGRTVEEEKLPHSLRAYFIRRGEQAEPVRYEVERLRNGRSFSTRRVVALQNGAVILNLEASFQAEESSVDLGTIQLDPQLSDPGALKIDSWTPQFERAFSEAPTESDRLGEGRATAWIRTLGALPEDPLVHAAALAFVSDDLPTDSVIRAHPIGTESPGMIEKVMVNSSLDHTIWFHRPGQADEWNMHDFSCHTFVGGRGLALGHVHSLDDQHIATVAQEIVLRDNRMPRQG